MSREVRRVPVGWQHPTEPDPYYYEREARIALAERFGHNPFRLPPSRLVEPGQRFVALDEDETPKGDGWCLYQTVSEGTPVTPVFATAEDLIDYLATVGQDHDEEPMRREAAEALVRTGWSLGSFVASPETGLVRSDLNADRLQ